MYASPDWIGGASNKTLQLTAVRAAAERRYVGQSEGRAEHAGDFAVPGHSDWDVLQRHAPPHFHARYGEHEVTVRIDDGAVEGRFPRRALALLLEWHALHREEARQLGTGSDPKAAADDRAIGIAR